MSTIPTIAEAAALIAAKKLSPVEFTRHRLARAQALNSQIHAFVRFTPEIALAQAQAAEARQMAGTLKGPLDGIPIGHKDIYETAGVATTGHSRVLENHVPEADSAAVQAWADAGAVMLGKLATHEFAWGGPSFDLPWPPARNPWNTDHFTGGSSSGTGAALAAGVILGGTGSDTGGSIRGPASPGAPRMTRRHGRPHPRYPPTPARRPRRPNRRRPRRPAPPLRSTSTRTSGAGWAGTWRSWRAGRARSCTRYSPVMTRVSAARPPA